MICVECGKPVNDIYKEFGKGSGNIRLTRCVRENYYLIKKYFIVHTQIYAGNINIFIS